MEGSTFDLLSSVPLVFDLDPMLLVKRIFRGQAVDAEKARNLVEKSVRTSTRLVIFWSLLFLYGVKETLQGKFALSRAIPAGVFLLVFIGIFGWGIYRARRETVSDRIPVENRPSLIVNWPSEGR